MVSQPSYTYLLPEGFLQRIWMILFLNIRSVFSYCIASIVVWNSLKKELQDIVHVFKFAV